MLFKEQKRRDRRAEMTESQKLKWQKARKAEDQKAEITKGQKVDGGFVQQWTGWTHFAIKERDMTTQTGQGRPGGQTGLFCEKAALGEGDPIGR